MSSVSGKCPFGQGFDPLDDAFVNQPYPLLAQARQETPVAYLESVDLWLVSRYEDVEAVLADNETFSNGNAQAPMHPVCPEARQVLADGGFNPPPVMTSADAPLHTRVRTAVSQVVSFTPRRTAALKPWLVERVNGLIDAFAERGRADLVGELTARLPAEVIFRLVGFPPEDTPLLLSWCGDRLQFSWGRPSPEQQVVIAGHMAAYWQYCERFIAERAEHPRDDYASDLIALHREDPEALTIPEITSVIYGLTFAGQETTNNLMASMLLHLLTHRELWEELLVNPSLARNAIQEALRLEPPISAWRRVATRDTEIGGVPIAKGAQLLVHLGSAGHDSARFADGETFDLHRKDARQHLAFGKGIHYCLGAGLATLEAATVLDLLLTRLPDLRLADDQHTAYVPNLAFRGPTAVLAQWNGAAAAARAVATP